jgi:hypothetical protein
MKRLFYKTRNQDLHPLTLNYFQEDTFKTHIMALNQQQLNQQQSVIPGNDDAANLARQIQANTNITMKTEVVKLPDFYGDLSKDTITALEFMARIDECQVTNEWNDITMFFYFRLALRSQADKWLSSVVRHLQLTPAQKMWTRIRPSFKAEFAAFSDDKLIDGLANLSHRPGENPRMFSHDLRNSFTS